jgi:hypothetical protein
MANADLRRAGAAARVASQRPSVLARGKSAFNGKASPHAAGKPGNAATLCSLCLTVSTHRRNNQKNTSQNSSTKVGHSVVKLDRGFLAMKETGAVLLEITDNT